MRGRNGDSDIENGFVDTAGEGESGTSGGGSIDTHTLDLPGGLGSKESASNTEELGWIPVLGITMYKIGSW